MKLDQRRLRSAQPSPNLGVMSDRYLVNNDQNLLTDFDSKEQLLISLQKILKSCPPQKPWSDGFKDTPIGFWTGPTSIAYLFLRLAGTHPNLVVEGFTPTYWCNTYLKCGSEDLESAQDLRGWGIRNEFLAYNAVKAAASGDLTYVDRLETAITDNYQCPDVDNEHWSGRAGTLAILRIVAHWLPSTSDRINRMMEPLILHIMKVIPWTFSGHAYIGPAHGVIGILTIVVLCRNSLGTDPVYEAQLQSMLDAQLPNGHWPITPDPNLGSTDLVHHCHGSPGFVISLLKIRPFVAEHFQHQIDIAVTRGRREVWEKGLLRKEPNLCHGIVGNMLALETWDQRSHFMAHATAQRISSGVESGDFRRGDDSYGLLWGEAGRAWGWAMMDVRQDLGYPSYTDV